jgi:hypothetical protein
MADSPQDQVINQEVDNTLIGELLDGYMPKPEGEGDPNKANPPEGEGQPPQATEPKPGEEVKPKEGEAKPEGEGEPAKPAVQPKPEFKTYEYRGKQYTIEQLVELGMLEDVLQTARQFPTIQTKYQQLLEERRLAPQPGPGQPAQPQGQPQPQRVTAEQVLAAYTPVMEAVANEGYIEKEAVEAFPRLCSALMQHRDLLYDVRQAVAMIMQHGIQRQEVDTRTSFLNYLDGLCEKVGGQGDHYAPIKDADIRKGFYEYLATLSIPANEVSEDFVKRQWVAYNHEAMLEAAKTSAIDLKAKDVKNRRNAAGEGGGPRPAAPAKADKTNDNVLIDSFLDGDKRFTSGG